MAGKEAFEGKSKFDRELSASCDTSDFTFHQIFLTNMGFFQKEKNRNISDRSGREKCWEFIVQHMKCLNFFLRLIFPVKTPHFYFIKLY